MVRVISESDDSMFDEGIHFMLRGYHFMIALLASRVFDDL